MQNFQWGRGNVPRVSGMRRKVEPQSGGGRAVFTKAFGEGPIETGVAELLEQYALSLCLNGVDQTIPFVSGPLLASRSPPNPLTMHRTARWQPTGCQQNEAEDS